MAKATGSIQKEKCRLLRRYRLTLWGIVQGVGFRPFVYRVAQSLGVRGTVYNASSGVCIDVEGEEHQVKAFIQEVLSRPPRLARIAGWHKEELEPYGWKDFSITTSITSEEQEVIASPDVALCNDCRREVEDPFDRHYLYPFTNCTNCGPRFTIIFSLPYDRSRTAMASFGLCPECAAEYTDPTNRRFHAQPIACPACGPQVKLLNNKGQPVTGDWLKKVPQLLKDGYILAIKGLGGFHLACDATNRKAVKLLRLRKGRPRKPFAVMARDIETVKQYCFLTEEEAALLSSPAAPIVLLRQRPNTNLVSEVAPGLGTLGVMLPYTPLHLLILQAGPPLLVMTSANLSDLPLVKDNDKALKELSNIADFFLCHNREIVNRCDDSVVTLRLGGTHFYRRSRGYIPQAIQLDLPEGPDVLAVGGDLKNTFCLLKRNLAFLSQHIGDVSTLETQEAWREARERLEILTGTWPDLVACDLHHGYYSTRLAEGLGPKVIRIQHHHAHLASCLAENQVKGPVLGIIADGTGYGLDGAIWGGEILKGSYEEFERIFHLKYVPLPSGDQGVRKPWYLALSYLYHYLGLEEAEKAAQRFLSQGLPADVVLKIFKHKFGLKPTSSLGRLFDAVAALIGVCLENTYDGQAPSELEEVALTAGKLSIYKPYSFKLEEREIDPRPLIEGLWEDYKKGIPSPILAARFHRTIAEMLVQGVKQASEITGIRQVALSGGVWHNALLQESVYHQLTAQGFTVYAHRLVPTNDGGLALGQATIARCLAKGD